MTQGEFMRAVGGLARAHGHSVFSWVGQMGVHTQPLYTSEERLTTPVVTARSAYGYTMNDVRQHVAKYLASVRPVTEE